MSPTHTAAAIEITSSRADRLPPSGVLGRGVGVMFQAFFGTVWLALASWAAKPAASLQLGLTAVLGLLIFAAGLSVVWRNRHARALATDVGTVARQAKQFRMLNALQWCAIAVLIVALNVVGRTDCIPPGIMLIVGLHYLPLAALFHYRPHLLTGAALTVLALIYPLLLAEGPASPAGAFCAGLIIWASAINMLIDIVRHARP